MLARTPPSNLRRTSPSLRAAAPKPRRRPLAVRSRRPPPHRPRRPSSDRPPRPPPSPSRLLSWLRRPASMPRPRKPVTPAAVAATSSTSQADKDTLETVIELVRKRKSGDATNAAATISDPVARKLAEWIILRGEDNGATVERYRAFLSANPSWPSQTFLRRRLEAAMWDDRRDDSVGVVVVRERIPRVRQGPLHARQGDAGARRPRQRRTSGARCLAQRSDVGRHREQRTRPVRRAADARRSEGADGHAALRQRERGRIACCEAPRGRLCRTRQGPHRLPQESAERACAARSRAARAARRSRLHLQQDPAAAPRGEICGSRPAHAVAHRRIRAGSTISTNGGSSGACWRAR